MTIKARYAGTCRACGGHIQEGESIEWSKSAGARHAKCGGGQRQHAARKAYSSRPATSREMRLREPQGGELIVHRDDHPYEIGQTLHATRVAGGGGTDGHYWTVVAASSHRISEGEDDTREGERRYDALVRPATEAEATACAERISAARAARQEREDALLAIQTGEGLGREEDARISRPTTMIASDPGRPGSLASYPYLIADQAGSVYHIRPVYDDSPVVTRLALSVDEAREMARRAGWRIA